jgi:DNA polymerase I-like protein with 3'-5' exonuclease and polymerase domains
VLEVGTTDEAHRLNDWLLDYPDPVGVDTETLGWSPDHGLSPVGRARVWCMTLAWGSRADRKQCFVPKQHLHTLKPWLESDRLQKVGTNLLGFDRHALANEGIELSGILADTALMSRLLDSRPALDDGEGHGLKPWGTRLGYTTTAYEELVTVERTRTVPGKEKEYKRCGVRQGVLYGGSSQEVRFKTETVELGLDEIWAQYPERRDTIKRYACLDPELSLTVYEHLKGQLKGRKW